MRFKLAKADVENPVGGGDQPFPVGQFNGVVDLVKLQVVEIGNESGPQFVLQPNKDEPPIGQKAVVASIQLGSNKPALEGGPQVGERKFFDDLLVLSVDGYLWDEPQDNEPTWRLDQTRKRLTNFAMALGATEEEGDEIGPSDNFDDLLRSGALNGMDVGFEVGHNKGKKKPDERYPFIKTYLPVV